MGAVYFNKKCKFGTNSPPKIWTSIFKFWFCFPFFPSLYPGFKKKKQKVSPLRGALGKFKKTFITLFKGPVKLGPPPKNPPTPPTPKLKKVKVGGDGAMFRKKILITLDFLNFFSKLFLSF